MTTTTVPQAPHGSVQHYVGFLRKRLDEVREERRDEMILPAVMGTINSILAFHSVEPTEKLALIQNLLAAEKIVASEEDAAESVAWSEPVAYTRFAMALPSERGELIEEAHGDALVEDLARRGLAYERELDPEQPGAPIPSYVEGHGETGRGSMGTWG